MNQQRAAPRFWPAAAAALLALTVFAAGILVASVARADNLYHLNVFCDDSPVATAILGHTVVTNKSAGTIVRCAGRCRGGMVQIADVLAGLPAEVRTALTAKVEEHEANAAAGRGRSLAECGGGDPSGACDPTLYKEYLRKWQVAKELSEHAHDLRLKAISLLKERMGAEVDILRFEAEKEVASDLAWENFGRHVQRGMRDSRGALDEAWLTRKIAQNAPFAAKAWNAIGWLDLLVQATARGWLTAGEWQKIQKEAENATRAAEDMWRKALADFEAHLKQQPRCLAESRKAAEEQKKLDRAKQVIEEWENNQVLYRDPITREALTYEAALKRAKQLLDSGRISRAAGPFVRVASAPAGTPPSQQALEAAIRELDAAIASFDRLNKSISGYLRAQYAIEAKIEQAFAQDARTLQQEKAGAAPTVRPGQKGGVGIDPRSILKGIFGR